jgi:hypothetical protein
VLADAARAPPWQGLVDADPQCRAAFVGKIFGLIYVVMGLLFGLFFAMFTVIGGAIAANRPGAAAGVPPVAVGIAAIFFCPSSMGSSASSAA